MKPIKVLAAISASVIGVLVLCCGGFFLYSLLSGGGLPFGLGGSATPTTELVVDDGTPQGEETPDSIASPEQDATPDQAATDAAATSALQQATATGAAQEAAIATRVAESTVTAEARASATAAAIAPTREVELAIQQVLNAQNNDPLFGPDSGSLVHVDDGFVKAYYADVDVQDFVVDAVFYNPYAASRGNWDIGYSLREGDVNDQFRLAVESNGDWSLADRRGDDSFTVHSGTLSNLNTGEGEGNRLTLYLRGDQGYLFVNGQYIPELDVSRRMNSGDVAVATGLFAGYLIEGEETTFEQFTVWPVQ